MSLKPYSVSLCVMNKGKSNAREPVRKGKTHPQVGFLEKGPALFCFFCLLPFSLIRGLRACLPGLF